MQPIFLHRQPENNNTIKVLKNAEPHIHQRWHFHNELEIAYIEKGSGTRFVGDNIQPYEEGDLVLIGPNLPHQWKSNYEGDLSCDYDSKSLAIYFRKDFPGKGFYELPELGNIKNLFRQSFRGIKVKNPKTKDQIFEKLSSLLYLSGIEKILSLFSILELVANAKDNELLASEVYANSFNSAKDKRIQQIYEYINNHFKSEITLHELSAHINMTPNSFCRYFKKMTNKTPIQFVNESRINYACQLLVKRDKTISQCAFESGFNNLANFNRRFKLVIGISPTQYMMESEHGG